MMRVHGLFVNSVLIIGVVATLIVVACIDISSLFSTPVKLVTATRLRFEMVLWWSVRELYVWTPSLRQRQLPHCWKSGKWDELITNTSLPGLVNYLTSAYQSSPNSNDLTVITDQWSYCYNKVGPNAHTYVRTNLHLQHYVSALQCQDKKLRCKWSNLSLQIGTN